MSSVNYSLKHKGIRLISSEEAWSKTNNGKYKLNTKNIVRLYPLPEGKYPLSKESGVDKKVYTRECIINKISG